jgi:hypothetical protein
LAFNKWAAPGEEMKLMNALAASGALVVAALMSSAGIPALTRA